MYAHFTNTTVSDEKSVTLVNLPFAPGEDVDIIVLRRKVGKKDYSLRGTPISYDEPTEPVAPMEWEAIR